MTTSPTVTESPFDKVAEGVELRTVRRHADRGTTFFVRMRKGAHAPRHGRPVTMLPVCI